MITLPENSSLDQIPLDIKDLDEVIVIQGDYFTRFIKMTQILVHQGDNGRIYEKS
jgi:hypothetical protein